METAIDFKISDDYESLKENYRDEARDEFNQQAEVITIQCESCVDNIKETLHINNVLQVSGAINEVLELAQFSYKVQVTGRYQNYPVELRYDFTNQAKDFLADAFGISGDIL